MKDLLIHSQYRSSEQEEEAAPKVEVLTKEKEEEDEDKPWRVMLFDDDIHTFDEVIQQLMKALNCNASHAEELTFKVHNEGKAKVYEGTFEDCFEVNGVLKEIQLVTEIKG
ncbi:MAG TPA: ATP-dependent Clp protease adaptor ClpS [Balneolaceae bacterium]|nr:ATP-dependent Clp protease adaptor ClpS [Balneolaceae bacterium]